MLPYGAGTAFATTCTVAGHTYTCEVTCTGTTPCNVETQFGHGPCDSPLGGGNNDGYCTICGDNANNNITGTNGKDIICGKGGNDTIYGDTGTGAGGAGDADIISGGDGDDTINGRAGNDLIFGDDGNDSITGGYGDDEIDGGNGNDWLSGSQGNDVVRGGSGDDYVEGMNTGTNQTADVGDILCGGTGNDVLVAQGSGAHCLDAGPDQVGPYNDSDCFYLAPSGADAGDLATERNCADTSFSPSYFEASMRSCNCQD